jgi:hypothetical protein
MGAFKNALWTLSINDLFFKNVTKKYLQNRTIKLGKFGEFKSSELIGKPYNVTLEIFDRTRLRLAQSESLLDIIGIL